VHGIHDVAARCPVIRYPTLHSLFKIRQESTEHSAMRNKHASHMNLTRSQQGAGSKSGKKYIAWREELSDQPAALKLKQELIYFSNLPQQVAPS
jgi:hypothetical protein